MRELASLARAVHTATGYAVLVQLCNDYSDIERTARLSVEQLMAATGRSRASVLRARHYLAELGLIAYVSGDGRGHPTTYYLPVIAAALDADKGIKEDNLLKEERVSNLTPNLTERVSTANRKGIKSDISLQDLDLGRSLVLTQGLTRDETRPPACESDVEPAAETTRKPADTAHQHVVDYAFGLWDLAHLSIPGGKGAVIRDLAALLRRCNGNEDDAKGILTAFHAGLNGDRPHFAIVIDHVGRWQQAGRPTSYTPAFRPDGGTFGKSRTTSYVNAERRPDGTERFGGETQAAHDRTLQRIAERRALSGV